MTESHSPDSALQDRNSKQTGNDSGLAAQQVQLLMAVVIQIQDERNTIKALEQLGFTAIRLTSTGAFLGRRNVTLLVGLPEERLDEAVSVIGEHCRPRVEYISTPLEGAPMPIPIATPIPVGGATVFTLRVDRFEEY